LLLSYLTATHSLEKTFVSIKGIYYQARVHNQAITWLVPFQFPTKYPKVS
jgi:pescadillo protein